MQSSSTNMESEENENTTLVFSVKFLNDKDDFEIVPETTKDSTISDFHCRRCGKMYKYFMLYKNHVQVCQGKKDTSLHYCPICNKSYKSTVAFEKHVVNCFKPKNLPCLVDRSLCFCCEEPLKNAHTAWLYPCNQCSKSFRSKKGVDRHTMLLHAKTTKFSCELCNAQCANIYILKLHRQFHNDEMDQIVRNSSENKCDICDKTFLDHTAFSIHRNTHKWDDTRLLNDEIPTDLDNEKKNNKNAEGKFKHRCDLCGKYLSSVGFLRRHVKIHRKYNQLPGMNTDTDVETPTGNSSYSIDSEKNCINNKTNIVEELATTQLNSVKIPQKYAAHSKHSEAAANQKDVVILNGKTLHAQKREELNASNYKRELDVQTIMDAIVNDNDVEVIDYFPMDEITLKESILELLKILLDSEILEQFGWPDTSIEKVLVNVLHSLDCEPSSNTEDISLQLRENVKLLIEAVGDPTGEIGNNNYDNNIYMIDSVLSVIIKNGYINK